MRDTARTFKAMAFPACFLLGALALSLLAHWLLDLLQGGWGRFREGGFYVPLGLGVLAGLCAATLAVPGLQTPAAAIFWRNIKSYFSSVIGYVFLFAFVSMCTLAAFWPNEFFNSNVANLDQLNWWMPRILLVLVPAITMGIWADERRQGTDELLLTMPASDFEVVMGKYLAAVGIYTAALLFSAVNVFWLAWWGDPDWGLLLANFVGYWMVGLLMLSIGMVASVMSTNLTVAFVFAALLNLPLVMLAHVDLSLPEANSIPISQFGLGEQLQDFSRGVIDLVDVLFLALGSTVALYLCVVLIGRRHWFSGSDARFLWNAFLVLLVACCVETVVIVLPLAVIYGASQGGEQLLAVAWPPAWGLVSGFVFIAALIVFLGAILFRAKMSASLCNLCHYCVRALSLSVLAQALVVAALVVPTIAGLRADVTAERLNSLSDKSRALLRELPSGRAVILDAYVSPTVPKKYVQTRLNLLAVLREFQAIAGGKLQVRIHDTEPDTDQAAYAEEQFGIQARQVFVRNEGSMAADQIFLGLAATSGLNKVVVPFFDLGVPVEYELARSVATVSQQERKRVGVLSTDARLYGGFNPMQMMQATQNEPIIAELEKQYEVVQVDANAPITERYDVLLAVQPSSLSPEQMQNFVAAVRSGQPTALFEDPVPFLDRSVPGTAAPKQPGGMMFMQQPPQPKGDIQELWTLLGIDFSGSEVVWQDYNPYPEIGWEYPEFVFVGHGCPRADQPFNPHVEVTAQLQTVLFLFPGFIRRREASTMTYDSLVFTGRETGTTPAGEIVVFNRFSESAELNRVRIRTEEEYVLAARIQGKARRDLSMQGGQEDAPAEGGDDPTQTSDDQPGDAPAEGADEAGASPADAAGDDQPLPEDDALPEDGSLPGNDGLPEDDALSEEEAASEFAEDLAQQEDRELNVIVVGDIDVLYGAFFNLREQGRNPDADVYLDLDNVTFVLNVLDELAGDERFIEVRSRRPRHRTLSTVEARIDETKAAVNQATQDVVAAYKKAEQAAQARFDAKVAQIADRTDIDIIEKERQRAIEREIEQRRLQAKTAELERQLERDIREAERRQNQQIRMIHLRGKALPLAVNWLGPALLGGIVFVVLWARESQGASDSRLRRASLAAGPGKGP